MTRRHLKRLLAIFFVALAVPTSILVYQAYGQLKWEAFHQHQQLARELVLRIDADFEELIEREENRPFTDYAFLNVTGTEQAAFLQRSPLSGFPIESELPGLLGYFQVDTLGQLQTPIVPRSNAAEYGIDAAELRLRIEQENQLRAILGENRLAKNQLDSNPAAPALPALEAEAPGRATLSSPAARVRESLDEDSAAMAEQDALGLPAFDSLNRQATIASEERKAAKSSAAEEDTQGLSAFDSLNNQATIASKERSAAKSSGRVADLKLDDRYEVAAQLKEKLEVETRQRPLEKRSRTETNILPESSALKYAQRPATAATEPADIASLLTQQQDVRIRTFESEVGGFEFSLLDSGHFVLFRQVWHNNQRYVQGLLFNQDVFVEKLIASAYQESALASVSDLVLAHQGNVVQLFGARYARGYASVSQPVSAELLYQTRLVAPFSDLELIFSMARLPIGAGGQIILWSAFVLGLVLIGGVLMLYRLGAGQISLAQQQQDFVSAVSHELKTPITSIRMYGEMLREGWADESRKKSYYDFIFNESERLSRLINNVLQLARLSRNEQKANLVSTAVERLIEDLSSSLESQLKQAGFVYSIQCDPAATQESLNVDSDWVTQIMINLVDNAIKFSANAEKKQVDLRCRLQQGRLVFSVRDYGPGIANDQMKKIFKLFYRSETELTRETVGTGIGLSLVQQLASAMHAEVDVVNCTPGAEFRVSFPLADQI